MSTHPLPDQPSVPGNAAAADADATRPRETPATPAAAHAGATTDPSQEAILWTGRTHWKYYAGRLLLWALACVLLAVILAWVQGRADWLTAWGTVKWLFIIVVLSGLIVVGSVALKVWACRYRLTTQRLFIERGLFSRTVDQTELIRVDDVRLHKSLLNRIFGVGTIVAVTTDATDPEVTLSGIADAESVAEAIRQNTRTLRRKSLYVEHI